MAGAPSSALQVSCFRNFLSIKMKTHESLSRGKANGNVSFWLSTELVWNN